MKKLQILGTGCAKCDALLRNTEQAARELGIEYTIEKNERSRGAILLRRICGGLVLAGGLYLIYIAA